MVAAVKMPRSSILSAVEMGWLAGLPDVELEGCILEYLQAVAGLCELDRIDRAIQEASTTLPSSRSSALNEAIQARDRIQELTDKISQSMAALDIEALRSSIEICENEAWPSEVLQEAYAMKQRIEDLLLKLTEATKSRNLQHLEALIRECEAFGLPGRDISEARDKRDAWQHLLKSLELAVERKDLDELNEAIYASQATCLHPSSAAHSCSSCACHVLGCPGA